MANDCIIRQCDLSSLLRLVGLRQLLQRRLLRPMLASTFLYLVRAFINRSSVALNQHSKLRHPKENPHHYGVSLSFFNFKEKCRQRISTYFCKYTTDYLIWCRVASLHILASGWDQFVENVLKQEGELHQVLRDLGFMVPDILHLLLPWQELKIIGRRRGGVPPSHLISSKDFTTCAISVAVLWIICLVAL